MSPELQQTTLEIMLNNKACVSIKDALGIITKLSAIIQRTKSST